MASRTRTSTTIQSRIFIREGSKNGGPVHTLDPYSRVLNKRTGFLLVMEKNLLTFTFFSTKKNSTYFPFFNTNFGKVHTYRFNWNYTSIWNFRIGDLLHEFYFSVNTNTRMTQLN